jgi:large-conductance mechanosensitive channel
LPRVTPKVGVIVDGAFGAIVDHFIGLVPPKALTRSITPFMCFALFRIFPFASTTSP